MPKRQKEKQYQSAREHRANQSLRSGSSALHSSATRPLPFDCCAFTLTPYAMPVCTSDGIIFDNTAITPHLIRHKVDPVTGRAMTSRDLIMLNMDKDESTGRWQCPVLNKPFTNRAKVVAIRQRPPGNEANVFSYEAYHELNVKAKNNLDLVSGKKFGKDDVIILQDPDNEAHCKLRDIQNFSHINSLRKENTRRQDETSGNVRHSVTASRIMERLDKEKRKRERAAEDQAKKLLRTDDGAAKPPSTENAGRSIIYTDELSTSVNLTSGKASGSLTSTAMGIVRENRARPATEEEILASQCEQLKRLKKRGMVRMFTNRGAMDIEVRCDIVPRTAMNFLMLAEKGEYDGSKFHRSIPNFMIQGGRKVGSKGKDGGSSIWNKPFPDEFDDRLKHAGGGVVSMANSGPGTNARQFFITYKSCAHLNRKHSVFGKVVGGLEILRKIEEIPTDKETDKPLETVKIERMEILENPVHEALGIEKERIQKRKAEKRRSDESRETSLSGCGSKTTENAPSKSGALPSPKAVKDDSNGSAPTPVVIGKYLKVAPKKSKKRAKEGRSDMNDGTGVGAGAPVVSRLPPPPKKTTFNDFSGW